VSATVALGAIATGITSPTPATSGAATGAGADSSFGDTLKSLVDGVEGSSDQANTAVAGMLDKSVDVHDAMIALQRAEMSLQLAVQVRNKLVQAYQDIMRMPV
jgi:flagellar hook-basal body complex protein FliE